MPSINRAFVYRWDEISEVFLRLVMRVYGGMEADCLFWWSLSQRNGGVL